MLIDVPTWILVVFGIGVVAIGIRACVQVLK